MSLLDRLEGLRRQARRGPELDRSVQADCNVRRHGLLLPSGLELEWLGTAGFRLSAQGTTLLIDPFVTRRDLRQTVTARRYRSDQFLVDQLLPSADAVLLGHTHFDHAVDAVTLARRGATVYGSDAAHRLLGLEGLADQAVPVVPGRPYEIGPFTVTFVPSCHAKLIAGLAVPAGGEFTCDSLDHLGAHQYRCGQVWGIHLALDGYTIYHQGSANLIEDEYRLGPVDLFLCGIAGRVYTRDFARRVLRTVQPTLVVAHHHDDFFRPVDQPMGFSLNVNLAGFVDDVDRLAPDIAVRTLDPFAPVGTGPARPTR